MKKILFLLIILNLFFISCNKNGNRTINTSDSYSIFIKEISKYNYQKEKIDDYYNIYKENENIIYCLNVINYPNFLLPSSYTHKAIINGNLTLVNTNYLLSSSYVPKDLVEVTDVDYIERKNQTMKLEKETLEAYKMLEKDAKNKGYELTIFSAYRSYEYQSDLYKYSTNKSFVAKPGASEHQTGLAIDIGKRNSGLTGHFDQTEEAFYLAHNAHKFGFILRYPKNGYDITGYPYESWHYRYVGKDVAEIIYKKNITLEEYFYNYVLL